MKTLGGIMYRSTISWPRQYLEVNDQLHVPAALPPEKGPRYSLEEDWKGPGVGLDVMEKRKFLNLSRLALRPLVV
jgi:hypothetical protein